MSSLLPILIGSQSETIITVCKEVAAEIGIVTNVERKIEDFLLAIDDNDYLAIIFDLDMKGFEIVKTIRLIRHIRPKIPLIVLVAKISKKLGGQIFNEGVFHLILSPPSKENLRSTLIAISKNYL